MLIVRYLSDKYLQFLEILDFDCEFKISAVTTVYIKLATPNCKQESNIISDALKVC